MAICLHVCRKYIAIARLSTVELKCINDHLIKVANCLKRSSNFSPDQIAIYFHPSKSDYSAAGHLPNALYDHSF